MSDSSLTPGPAYECALCETVTPVAKGEQIEECPDCGEYALVRLELAECGDDDCDHEDHHFGTGMHHTEFS